MFLRRLPLMLWVTCFVGAEAAAQGSAVSNDDIRDLRAQQQRLEEKLKTLGEQSKTIFAIQAEIDSTRASLGRLQANNERAGKRLEALQDVERKNPDSIQPEKLREAEEENRRTYRALTDARDNIGKLESRLLDIRMSVVQENATFDQLRREHEGRIDALVHRQVEERTRALQVKKSVEATGTAGCEQLTLAACRQLSQKNAELKASEQGSVVVIDSMTEVRNFKLTKEELRSTVSALLSDVTVLEQKLVDEQYYQTRISATVTPAISPALRRQLRESARSDLMARLGEPLNYSIAGVALLSAPRDTSEDAGQEAARQEEQRRRLEDERRRLEQERLQLAERRRQEEAERLERERREREITAERKKRSFTPTF